MNLSKRIAAAILAVGGAALLGQRATAAPPPDCTKLGCDDKDWVAACSAQKIMDFCKAGGDKALQSVTPPKTIISVSPIGTDRTPLQVYRMPPTIQIQPKPQPAMPAQSKLVSAGTSPKAPAVVPPAHAASGVALPGTAVDTRHFAVGAVGSQRLRVGKPITLPGARTITMEGADAKADFIDKGMDSLKAFGDDPAQRLAKEAAAIKNRRPNVGDPLTQDYHKTPTDPSRYVQSCDDYVYKKYFEYNWFVDTVQALGADYRAIFDVATRADSPVKITRHLRSFGPDVPPQKIELASGDSTLSGTGLAVLINLDFENSGLGSQGGSTVDADWEITNWNSFYSYEEMIGTPFTKAGPARGAPGSIWQGINQVNVTKWFDLAMKLEQSHRGFSDGELDWAAERSQHLASLITQRRQAIWAYANSFCPKGSLPQTTDQINFTCLVRNDGKYSTTSVVPNGKPPANGPKPINSQQAAQATQNGSSNLYHTITIKPSPLQAPAVLIIQADIDAAIQAEKQLLVSNPKESCLNPDPLASACTWSYRKFAGIIQQLEHDLIYRLTHNVVKREVATLAGPSYDLAKCRRYLPDFDVVLDKNDPDKVHTANNKIYNQVMSQRLWWSAYEPTDLSGNPLAHPPNNAFARGYWAQDWSMIEKLMTQYDNGHQLWAQFGEKRKEYLGQVAKLVNATVSLPWNSASIGQSSSDHFDQGTDLFGATAHYGLSWSVNPVKSTPLFPSGLRSNSPLADSGKCTLGANPSGAPGISCGDEKYICRYNGSMSASADAAALVLGGAISILDTGFNSWARDDGIPNGGAHMDAHFTFLGDELVPDDLLPKTGGQNTASSTGVFTITEPIAESSSQVPDPPFEVDFAIGPIPCSLQAGLVLSAGIDLSTSGQIGDTCIQQSLPKFGATLASPVVPPNFSLASTVEPYIKVSGFAQVGVDLVFVQAGVRIDLEVVKVGIPITVGVSTGSEESAPKSFAGFTTHADATFDALAGALSAYVDVNYLAGSYHYEQPIFGWDGLHASKPLFAYNKQYDLEGLNYRVNAPAPPVNTFKAMQQ